MDPGNYVIDDDEVQCKIIYSILEKCEKDFYGSIFSGKCMHVNCGPGNTTMSLLLPALHPHATLTGIDIDKDMIEFANKNNREAERLTFEVMDIQTKRLPDKYVSEYNHIFSFNTLQWCTDILQAFKNIYHMLRPGGTTLFYFEVKSDVLPILETLVTDDCFAPYSQELSNVYLYSKPLVLPALEIEEYLTNIGFTVFYYNQHNLEYYEFQDFESIFATTIASMSPLLHKLPVHLRENFKNQFASKFKKKYISSRKSNNLKNNIKSTLVIVHASKCPQVGNEIIHFNEISTLVFDTNILSLTEFRQKIINNIIKTYADVLRNMSYKCMNIGLGCGFGNITNLLLSALNPNATMIGIDTSKSVIEVARRLCENERLTFEVLNIETKDLPVHYHSEIDHIFSFYTLEECKDIRQAFVNIYRMLRVDGMAVLVLKTESNIPEIFETLRNDKRFKDHITMDKTKLLPYNNEFSLKRDIKNILKNIGFYIRHYTSRTEYCTPKYFDEYLDSFITDPLTPLISTMPLEKQKEFKEVFRNEITKRSIDPLLGRGIKNVYRKNVCTGDTILVFAEKLK